MMVFALTAMRALSHIPPTLCYSLSLPTVFSPSLREPDLNKTHCTSTVAGNGTSQTMTPPCFSFVPAMSVKMSVLASYQWDSLMPTSLLWLPAANYHLDQRSFLPGSEEKPRKSGLRPSLNWNSAQVRNRGKVTLELEYTSGGSVCHWIYAAEPASMWFKT